MELLLCCLLLVMLIAILVLIVKLCLLRKAAEEIEAAIFDRLKTDTNMLISISSNDKYMKHLADSLNRQLKLLRTKELKYVKGDAELKEAITNISHDLRTPLTAACGYMDLLKKGEITEKSQKYLEIIENRLEEMKRLTEEFFRYSMLTSVCEEKCEPVCINGVLEESLASFYAAMKQRNIVPEIKICEKRIEHNANRSELMRIFENIINNALKYSDGDFKVCLYEDGSVVFSNQAKELTRVEVGRLFDRFYTVEDGSSSTGLGLSIARLLAECNNGELSADYAEGSLHIRLAFCIERKQ